MDANEPGKQQGAATLPAKHKTHHAHPRPPFDRIALLLQGGGALGAYQGGVYQALSEADLQPDWIAGISIGAINSALIAGNPPERRVDALRTFWETITASPFSLPAFADIPIKGEVSRGIINQLAAFGNLLAGAPAFFKPRVPPPFAQPQGSPEALSYYDISPLRATLERLVDFDRINAGPMRFSVGAVNVRTGNFVYFDTTTHHIRAEHIMASGALPPGFPAVEIDGEHYWDGGLVSNTPLQWVLDSRPRVDTLAFQVDLWCAQGEFPSDLTEVDERTKDIRYSSRTRAATDIARREEKLRTAVSHMLAHVPEHLRDSDEVRLLAEEAQDRALNIIQMIYHAKRYEGAAKDYQFSRRSMQEHWRTGYHDAVRTLRHPEVLRRHEPLGRVYTFDLARQGRE
jgi:NTE family protein